MDILVDANRHNGDAFSSQAPDEKRNCSSDPRINKCPGGNAQVILPHCVCLTDICLLLLREIFFNPKSKLIFLPSDKNLSIVSGLIRLYLFVESLALDFEDSSKGNDIRYGALERWKKTIEIY